MFVKKHKQTRFSFNFSRICQVFSEFFIQFVLWIKLNSKKGSTKSITMNQAEVGQLVSALRVNLGARQRHVKDRMGYRGGKYLGSNKKTAVAKILY